MKAIACVAASCAAFFFAAPAVADAPRVYLPVMALYQTTFPTYKWLMSMPQVCGAHLFFPWSAIDSGGGAYDWSKVDAAIAQWAAVGKKVGLAFDPVDENFGQTYGPGTTTLATPSYVMSQVDSVNCGTLTKSTGTLKDTPPTPVYWEPGFQNNWKRFIRVALVRYQDNPNIAFMSFGIGAAEESFPMTEMGSSQECMAAWNSHGMSYSRWLKYALGIIDHIGRLAPRVPITVDVNSIGSWDSGTLGFAAAIAAEAQKYGFIPGNDGFTGLSATWNPHYTAWRQTGQTYGMVVNPALADSWYPGQFPSMLTEAQALGLQLVQLNPHYYWIAYINTSDPNSAAYRTGLEGLGTPGSCSLAASAGPLAAATPLQPVTPLAPIAWPAN